MKLRNIDFKSNVLIASGTEGFLKEGYWFHKPLILAGKLDFTGTIFVSKTSTLLSRKGNMPLTRRYTPRSLWPLCIRLKILRKATLNSVALSGPGIGALLGMGVWQNRTDPFGISVMPVSHTKEKRMEELRIIRDIIAFCIEDFKAPFFIQLNSSCPNVKGHKPSDTIGESAESAGILSILGVPIMQKFSIASAPLKAVMELNDNPNCDAICVSNTIPFGWEGLDWKEAWGSEKSPIAHLGGGGLSGPALLPLVCQYIRDLRELGFTKHINGGGGIMCPADVDPYHDAGANSISLGTIASMSPGNVLPTTQYANSLTWRQ